MQRAAFFDIDGTLTSENVWRGVMEYFKIHNLRRGTHAAFMLTHMPRYILLKVGVISEIAFRSSWAADLAWYVRGLRVEEAEPIWDWVAEEFLDRNSHWRPDSCRLIGHHLTEEDVVVLVSSGPEPLIARLARGIDVPHAVGTRFEISPDGRYTGRSVLPVCIDQYKASMAKQLLADIGIEIDYAASFAYADSITDLGMFEMVGNPVAVYPDPALRSLAEQRGWEIFEQLES